VTAKKTLEVATSPHVSAGVSVDQIMRDVVLALVPVTVFAVYHFGLAALLTLTVAVASCVATERWLARRATIGDWSAACTGVLLGLTLPPGLPLWMTAVGGLVAIAAGKVLFGGLGGNVFNPALVGRAFLSAAFPAAMTSWLAPLGAERFTTVPGATLTWPFMAPELDAMSAATPLAAWKFEHIGPDTAQLALGLTAGSTGETSTALIVLGGLYLVLRGVANWRIPVAVLGTVALLSGGLHQLDPARFPDSVFMLCSGGLALGAVFMATDPVGSPLSVAGAWLYGALIGVLTLAIRCFGGLPEGVMYAILLANAAAPLIDRWVQPRVFGTGRAAAERP
jgi:electron transport complex protein RnfD